MRAMSFAFDGFSFTRSAMGVDYHLIPQMHVLFFGPIECARKISPARLAGVICNSRNVAGERELVSKFAEELGSKLISFIPRDGSSRRRKSRARRSSNMRPNPIRRRSTTHLPPAWRITRSSASRRPQPRASRAAHDRVRHVGAEMGDWSPACREKL